jgi:hypothetical protein
MNRKIQNFHSGGQSVAQRIEDVVRLLGKIQKDALIQTLDNLDIRDFLARMGVMNQNTSVESMSQRLRRWIPAAD